MKVDLKNGTAAFIMGHWMVDDEQGRRFLDEAIRSVVDQTDPNWCLIIVDDHSENEETLENLRRIENELGSKVKVIYSPEHIGPGPVKNLGIKAAYEMGAPFVLYIDDDDRSDPRRLEYTRNAFLAQPDVNVVYSSFDVIDENTRIVPEGELCDSIREILEGHKEDVLEGENTWIRLGIEKNYTNLPSCTAVRTDLAMAEPFPPGTVSEDSNTWYRYAAHPGRFVFLDKIKNQYRICSGTDSRARSMNRKFYAQKAELDSDGFEKAVKISIKNGLADPDRVDDIRARFYVRLALSMLRGGDENEMEKCLKTAVSISSDAAKDAVKALHVDEKEAGVMTSLINNLSPRTPGP